MSNYPQQPYQQVQPSDNSNSTIAIIIEIVFGFFGILGMGWLYAGNIGISIAVFVAYAILVFIEFWVASITLGIALCVIIPFNIALIVVSGFKARDYMRNSGAKGSFTYVLLGLVVGGLVICGGIALMGFGLGLLNS